MGDYDVVVGSGTLRSDEPAALTWPHRWTDEGVTVLSAFTGAHLFHLSAAGCVLNDIHREALGLGIPVDGVRVTASGGFDADWRSTGITYAVEVDSPATAADVDRLVAHVDEVAEIPKVIRAGTSVDRA